MIIRVISQKMHSQFRLFVANQLSSNLIYKMMSMVPCLVNYFTSFQLAVKCELVYKWGYNWHWQCTWCETCFANGTDNCFTNGTDNVFPVKLVYKWHRQCTCCETYFTNDADNVLAGEYISQTMHSLWNFMTEQLLSNFIQKRCCLSLVFELILRAMHLQLNLIRNVLNSHFCHQRHLVVSIK